MPRFRFYGAISEHEITRMNYSIFFCWDFDTADYIASFESKPNGTQLGVQLHSKCLMSLFAFAVEIPQPVNAFVHIHDIPMFRDVYLGLFEIIYSLFRFIY